jgi:hypothetical protein
VALGLTLADSLLGIGLISKAGSEWKNFQPIECRRHVLKLLETSVGDGTTIYPRVFPKSEQFAQVYANQRMDIYILLAGKHK